MALVIVQHDLHRHTLDHLDEVARRVLRRQQAEAGPGGAGNAFDLTFERTTAERVDFQWPDRRVILEIDGPTHAMSTVQRNRDLRRDDSLRELGWRVVRVLEARQRSLEATRRDGVARTALSTSR